MKQRGLRAALNLINEERTYGRTLPDKSIHKLLYAVEKRARGEDISLTIPYYWYLWGTVSPLPSGTQPQPSKTEPTSDLEDSLRPIVSEVLEYYYENGLEGLTDYMYEDAPYDVQRSFRSLDKKVRTHHDDYHDFYDVEPSRESIEESVYNVFESFPSVKFPNHERDVTKWYALFTSELNEPKFDTDRLMQINLIFWRIVSLSLAERHYHGMDEDDVCEDLGITNFDHAREETRDSLTELEDEILDQKYDSEKGHDTSDVEEKVLDALAEPVLTQKLQMSFSD
jgi:DNA-binding protein Fis